MKIRDVIDFKNRYKTAYKNYISVIWNLYRGKNKIKVIFRNGNSNCIGGKLVWNYAKLITNKNVHISDLPLDSSGITFTYNGKSITLEGGIGAIGDVFGLEEYGFLKVENEIVIDIGANIGDTSIYFALNNAKTLSL